jgi:hypothetical protein
VQHTSTPHSGTKDKNYDLITVTQLCLEHVWRLEQYALDAERAGDGELASLFRRMQEHSRRGAEASKRLLGQRMGEEADGRDTGMQRERGRGAYGMERGPYGSAYGYRATSYRATGRWQPDDEWSYSSSLESRPTGAFVGRGPRSYTQSRERIVDRVSERLTDHPDIDATEIQVDVQDGVVVLQGKVPDRSQKRLAEDVAESVSGVDDVRNELDVDKGLFQDLTDAITGRGEETAGTRAKQETSV